MALRLVREGVSSTGVGGFEFQQAIMIASITELCLHLNFFLAERWAASSTLILAEVVLVARSWKSVVVDARCAWKDAASSFSAACHSTIMQSQQDMKILSRESWMRGWISHATILSTVAITANVTSLLMHWSIRSPGATAAVMALSTVSRARWLRLDASRSVSTSERADFEVV